MTITTSDELTEQIESLHLCVQNNAEELAKVMQDFEKLTDKYEETFEKIARGEEGEEESIDMRELVE